MHERHRFRICRPLGLLLIATVLPLVGLPPADWSSEIRTLVASHQMDRAMNIAEEWIRKYPDDLDARAWRARIFTWQGHSSEAERDYRALLERMPDDPDMLLELARLWNSINRHKQALDLLERATLQAPQRADCLLEKARTLAAVGRRTEARTLYLELAVIDSVSEQSRNALRDMREEGRHRVLVGAQADLLSYAPNGSAFSASLESRWNRRWSTAAGVTRYGRFGKSATGVEASATVRASASSAITVGGGSTGHMGIAPSGQLQLGYDHGLRVHSGFMRGMEILYDQRWVWYRDVGIVNFAPAALIQLPKNWNWLLGVSTARTVAQAGRPSWSRACQTRLMFPLHRRYTGQLVAAAGAENFGTLDQVLFRASKTAGGGVRVRLAPGQEMSTLIGYQRIAGGRSQISTGLSYAVHF